MFIRMATLGFIVFSIACGGSGLEQDEDVRSDSVRRMPQHTKNDDDETGPKPLLLMGNPVLRAAIIDQLNQGQSPAERRSKIVSQLVSDRSAKRAASEDGQGPTESAWVHVPASDQAIYVEHGSDTNTSFLDPSVPHWVVRYACCDGLMLFQDPIDPLLTNGTVEAGELLRVHEITPGQELLPKLSFASEHTILPDLLDPRDEVYWARVEAPNSGGREGWVPLYSLVLTPLEVEFDDVQVDLSYGKIARELNTVWTDIFSPQGCEETRWYEEVEVEAGECFYVEQPQYCDGEICYETCDETDELYEKWEDWANDSSAECVPQILDDGTTTTDCKYIFDRMFATPGEKLWYPRYDGYECGEYPFGTTHWNHKERPGDKKLHEFELWGEQVVVKMDRFDGQNASEFDVKSLSHHGGLYTVAQDKKITAAKLWLGFSPHEATDDVPAGYTEFKVCAYMPGGRFWVPKVDFDNKKTPKNAVDWIGFGTLDVGQVQGCLYGEVHLDDNWQPQIVWTETDNWWIQDYDLSKVGFDSAGWIKAVAAAGSFIFPALGGVLGAALAVIMDAVVLGADVIVPSVLNNVPDNELSRQFLVYAAEAKLSGFMLKWLNEATTEAISAAIPPFRPMAQDACDAVCGPSSLIPGDPMQPFCQRCDAFAAGPAPIAFVRDPGARDKGCYDVHSLFTPSGKVGLSTSPWWYDYRGFGWASGDYGDDKGCKLGIKVPAVLEKKNWELAKCAMWRANTLLNRDQTISAGSLRDEIRTHCQDVGREMLRLYYGTGEDFEALMRGKFLDIESSYINPNNPSIAEPEPFEFTTVKDVRLSPSAIQADAIAQFPGLIEGWIFDPDTLAPAPIEKQNPTQNRRSD